MYNEDLVSQLLSRRNIDRVTPPSAIFIYGEAAGACTSLSSNPSCYEDFSTKSFAKNYVAFLMIF